MVGKQIKSLINNLSSSENFIETLCISLAQITHASRVFIADIDDYGSLIRTISFTDQKTALNGLSFNIKNTPCADTFTGEVNSYLNNCHEKFPAFAQVLQLPITSYIGIPLKKTNGKTHAILVALFKDPIINTDEAFSLCQLFSNLLSKELEKQTLIDELKTRNKVIDESHEGIIICDKHKNIVSINKALTRITGYTLEDVKGKNPRIFSAGITDKGSYNQMWKSINDTGAWSGEVWNKKKNGDVFPEWLSINVICDEKNNICHYVAFFFDISKRKASEAKIYSQANLDLLTGLANRFAFSQILTATINTKRQQQSTSAVIYLDLDLFKEINDIYGHDFGDELLIKTAERLSSYINDSDCVARITGDGFAILISQIQNDSTISNLVTRILIGFNEPFCIADTFLHCTLSIGITTFQDSKNDAANIMKKSETAMYHAKDNGRNSFSFFTEDMQKVAIHRLNLKNELSDALKNRDLSVVFQPIISIERQQVEKFEALVRWNHNGEWMSPLEFIPVAEEFSLIKSLGEFVLSEACNQLKKLKSQGYNNIVFNVNRSAYEIPLNKSENDHWLIMINLHGLAPQDICFELTESALAPDKKNNELLFSQLRKSGCSIALDDFGTGYSSLSYLRHIPIDCLKIDKSFITDMSTNKDDNILVSTIIAMSKALGKKVVAEGVETKEQLKELTELGCDYIQGYYFSKPLPAGELSNFIDNFQYDKTLNKENEVVL